MMIDNHNVIPEVIYEVLSTWSLVGHKDYKHHFMYGVYGVLRTCTGDYP